MSSPRASQASARREQIIASTRELVSQRGFDAVSMADIVKASDVPMASVYRYFDSKEAIVFAITESMNGGSLDEDELAPTDVEDAIDQLLTSAATVSRGQLSAQVWAKTMGSESLQELLHRRHASVRRWIARSIAGEGIDAPTAEVGQRADAIICTLVGLQLYLAGGVSIDVEAMRATLLTLAGSKGAGQSAENVA